jgi:hypothetical protein
MPNAAKFNSDFSAKGKRLTPELTRAERSHSTFAAMKHHEKNAIEASGSMSCWVRL